MASGAAANPRFVDRKPHELLWRRLSRLAVLSDAVLSDQERSMIRQTCAAPGEVPAGAALYVEGEPLRKPGALLAGWACRLRLLPDGRRQIFDFLLPGDLFGHALGPEPFATTSAVTLTTVSIAGTGCLWEMGREPDRFPGLVRALAAAHARQQALLLDHVVRLGRQTAQERVAHLLLELGHRLDEIGFRLGSFVPLPLTQEVMADALGLSVVHVNRTLQQLKRERLIETKAASVRLIDPVALATIADFRLPPGRPPAA
ncbi:Crp/Fnr family transcriptional regulator [Rhodoplanes sp. SY1]|uniref:Crp/Fnr family transcriptional regulator n=1 Tax=Rhodoplanes sp. SY1 TaxID=3166646 RepID=UPI0038B60D6E